MNICKIISGPSSTRFRSVLTPHFTPDILNLKKYSGQTGSEKFTKTYKIGLKCRLKVSKSPKNVFADAQHIILIDGQKLAELMIEYELGVSTQKVYKIKRIDSD